jgi:hypothetical protein
MTLVAPLLAVLFMAGLSVRRVAALDGRPWYATATAALFGLGFYSERRWKLPTTSSGVRAALAQAMAQIMSVKPGPSVPDVQPKSA